MLPMLPLLQAYPFAALQRRGVSTLQANLGYRCNQTCLHCHVNAGPNRLESMDLVTMETLLQVLDRLDIRQLDLTGGAPELNPHFRWLVQRARARGVHVIDRCNLSILREPGQVDLAQFLAQHQVEVIASLPCYLRDNVDAQRGAGSYDASLAGLRHLNALGYGDPQGELRLNLVYNPTSASLPPPQGALESDYRRELAAIDIRFNQLFTITNMPIARFGSTLVSRGEFAGYMQTLQQAHSDQNLPHVMCRDLISVDYRGRLFDCDFNQMLDLPMTRNQHPLQLQDLLRDDVVGLPIAVSGHCFGCTAGSGSSCGGALA